MGSTSNLEYLNCYSTQINSLDLDNIPNLTYLDCHFSSLTNLDVSNNSSLIFLNCQNQAYQFNNLDLTNNPSLSTLLCGGNQLSCLNVKNGNNTLISDFEATYSPNLYCIEVDDAAWSTANWTSVDSQSSFSEDCNYPNPCGSGTTSINELTHPKNLLYITDILGRNTYPVPNRVLFYIYDDGSVEKKIRLER